MIDLRVNKEILMLLRKAGLYSDTLMTQYFILRCLRENNEMFLNILDDERMSKRFILQYYELVRMNLITEVNIGEVTSFLLTETGENLMKQIDELANPKPKVEESVESWFDEWMEMFPTGVKSGGRLVKSDKQGCLKKMKKFVKDYPFTKETILQATKEYLDEFQAKDWKFVKCATFFIHKMDEGSELAGRCEQTLDEPEYKQIFETTINNGLI